MSRWNLAGKSALVTGASGGIGRAIAIGLAKAGADVAVNYMGNRKEAEHTASAITAEGRKTIVLQGNVGKADEFNACVKETINTFGKLDILVNNAGITRDNLIMRMKEAEFDAVVETNLKGVFNGIQAVSRQMMRQRRGRIINISSVVGVIGNIGQANYVAAKAGVIGLTKSAARELATRGITVNAVAPGFIESNMTAKLAQKEREKLLASIPLGRMGQSEEVANLVVFLASEQSAYLTGQTLHIDGGISM